MSITILFISLACPTISAEASKSTNTLDDDLISIDTSIVPDSYELDVLVNKNDPKKEDIIIFVDDHVYKIVKGKLVETSPIFMPYATDSKSVTLDNGSYTSWSKYASQGTTVHTGSTGPAELREHKIMNSSNTILSSIKGSAASIGCQKTVTSTGTYKFTIVNLSAATQTWNWTITF
ncbi:hypothetical protein LIT25_16235 [Bacillus sp. F19]|nr:hypothetical protein LIT25_16235 [Bacillus sp. F19]